MISSNEIRSSFLDFFKRNDHQVIASSPLVPRNDPTLMFTSAGMVQFKNLFTGVEKANYTRAATSQKCMRAGGKHNDLENVGYTARHHTFFEMLGNFSFGDYFKADAIEFAWKFLTKELKIDKERLYITIYHTDNEAYEIWKKLTSFNDSKIIKIDNNDNFWSAGDLGPCGPCSEIFYDHGSHIFGGLPGTKDQDGDRFVEIWNLVFMQFDQLPNERILLPKPSIDTGMGLERISAVMQGVHNNYEIDLFKNIVNDIIDITKIKSTNDNIASYRIIADHLRAIVFLIADGVMPSNEGRGYVLRRIIRRAIKNINKIGYKDILLYKLVSILTTYMGNAYPELLRAAELAVQILKQEEINFNNTLEKGLKLLNSEISNVKDGKLPGEVVFKLYDTYGFPVDLTEDILKEYKIEADKLEFSNLMNQQKEKARASWGGSGEKSTNRLWYDLNTKYESTEFLGYDSEKTESLVQAIISDDKIIDKLNKKDSEFYMLVNQSVFYAESGGQVGDIGYIYNKDSKIKVLDTKKHLKFIIHHCILEKGSIAKGDVVTLEIDIEHRKQVKANHSATHLLHAALRKILGSHVTQKGSLVTAEKLRFDFSHINTVSLEELRKIEYIVNSLIINNCEISTILTSTEKAIESGAMALFGEKYDDEVRVVSMGLDDEETKHFSTELCGGTHASRTGDIGLFIIVAESSVASGVRRIEALTGHKALEYMQSNNKILDNIGQILKTSTSNLENKIGNLLKEKKQLEKKISDLQKSANSSNDETVEKVNDVEIIMQKFNDINIKELRSIAENRVKNKDFIIVLFYTEIEGKISLVIAVSNNLINNKIDASQIAKAASQILGGSGGGGRPNLAQAGGPNLTEMKMVIEEVKKYYDKI